MLSERKVLAAALKDRKAWSVIKDHSKDLSPDVQELLLYAAEHYNADPMADSVDLEVLKPKIDRVVVSNKRAKAYCDLLDQLPEDVSSINVAAELVAIKKHQLGLRIAAELSMGRHDQSVQELLTSYQSMTGDVLDLEGLAEIQQVTGIDIKSLINRATDGSNLIKLLPKSLNDKVGGGLHRGHHMMIFARPEMGKTLFWINLVAGFLQQNLKVLIIENEEPIEDDLLRIGSRVTGMNKFQIRDDPEKAHRLIVERVKDLVTIVGLSPGTFSQIECLTDRYKPDVVIINQLRNVDVKSENRTQALEKASLSARTLAKSRNVLVISITQAGDSAENKSVLVMGDIDSSNTGMQGPTDVIAGIGASYDQVAQNVRFISLCKNKPGGGFSGSHEPIQVIIDPTLSKVME